MITISVEQRHRFCPWSDAPFSLGLVPAELAPRRWPRSSDALTLAAVLETAGHPETLR